MSTRRFLGVAVTLLLTSLLALSKDIPDESVAAAGLDASLGSPEANLKVACIGDQGANADTLAVLQLIANEQADMVLHQGDFDYGDNPTQWADIYTSDQGARFGALVIEFNVDGNPNKARG